jgi:hypothetical protein
MTPIFINVFTTSVVFSAILFANSWTVIISGTETSRENFASSPCSCAWSLSFSLALLSLARLGNLSNSCSSCSSIFFASSLLNSSSTGFKVDFFGVVFLLSIGFLFLETLN